MRTASSINGWSEPSTSMPRPLAGKCAGLTPAHAVGRSRPRCFCPAAPQPGSSRPVQPGGRRARGPVRLRAEGEDGGSKGDVKVAPDRIKETLAGLDALLGIEEQEREKREKEEKERAERERQREQEAKVRHASSTWLTLHAWPSTPRPRSRGPDCCACC